MPAHENQDRREVEELFKHTIELNKRYINQSFKLINQMGQQGNLDKNVFTFKPDLYARAIKTFSRMNLEYYNKVMDLGFSFADEVLFNNVQSAQQEEPSFTLRGSGTPGSEVKLQFVLENTRNSAVQSELRNTPFINEINLEEAEGIATRYTPQVFRQEPGGTHTVDITLNIGKGVKPGTYSSDVSVIGFEPTFFAMVLEVVPTAKNATHAKAKKRPKKG